MSQPTPYARQYNLNTYALNNPAAPYNASQHDAEFNAILVTLGETLTNLALLQRDDGGLKNSIVTPDSLNQATVNMIGEWNPRGAWVTATNYAVLDMVTPAGGGVTYVCNTAHTSGATFAADNALGYWQPVNGDGTSGLGPAGITFTTNNVILGRVTAGAGTGEEIACTAAARSILDDATVGDIRTTLGVGAASDPTFNDVIVSNLNIAALTGPAMIYLTAAERVAATAAPTNGQVLVGSTGAIPALATLTGTADQVTVTNGAASITLSLPQDIASTSTPTFVGLNLSGLSDGSIVFVGASSALSEEAGLRWDITANRLELSDLAPVGIPYIDGDAHLTVDITRLSYDYTDVKFGFGGSATTGFLITADLSNTAADVGQRRAFYATGTLPSTTTLLGAGYVANLATANAAFTLPDLVHFQALDITRGAASTITRVKGFAAHNEIVNDVAASTTYGFWSDLNTGGSGTVYQVYAGGTAESLFGGQLTANGLISAAGGQIKFPAAANPSADVNTLDDYEEGTWTPTLTFATPGDLAITYSRQVGKYTKIGNMVFLQGEINTSAFTHTTASGQARINGIPHNPLGEATYIAVGTVVFQGITRANYTDYAIQLNGTTTFLSIGISGSAQTADSIDAAEMPTGGSVVLRFSLAYIAA